MNVRSISEYLSCIFGVYPSPLSDSVNALFSANLTFGFWRAVQRSEMTTREGRNHCIGSASLPEIIFCDHSSSVHPQMQVKTPWSKEEVICENDPETLSSSLGQGHLNRLRQSGKLFCGQLILLEIMDPMSFRLKRIGTIWLVQKPWSLMVWGCIITYWADNIWTSGVAQSMLKGKYRF